jgi:hypothetical protein
MFLSQLYNLSLYPRRIVVKRTMSAADTFVYDDTLDNEVIEKPFISKEMQIVNDSNNGVYNNQILFSTSNLTGSGKYIDFQNSYIEIPVTMMLKADASITAGANAFMMGLKDGSIQLVDSIILQYNGTSVAQNSIFSNVLQHFKILSSWSYEDLIKWGPATYTWPDEPTAAHFQDAKAGPFGDGTSNTQVTPFNVSSNAQWAASQMSYNEGYLNRMRNAAFNGTSNGLISMTTANLSTVGRSHFTDNGGAGAAKVYVWQMLVTLRCKDLHDFFNKIPILKAGRIDMTINFNSFSNTITYVNGAGNTDGSLVTLTNVQLSGHSCPYLVSGAAVTGGASNTQTQPNGILGNAATLTVGLGINGVRGVSVFNGIQSDTINNCRWYVPLYEMNPEYEASLLASNPLKTIYYDDFYTYANINAQNGSFTSLITSGVKNPKYLILFPFFNSAQANSGNVGSYAPYQSCFDTAPATSSPITLSNFQVQCGGKTLFPLIQQYTFQQFMDEFSSIFAVNGGKSEKLTSGLISRQMWENSPVYVADLSRRLPQDDESAKSTVSSRNPTTPGGNAVIDIIAFVVYQRSATFNMVSGNLESAT